MSAFSSLINALVSSGATNAAASGIASGLAGVLNNQNAAKTTILGLLAQVQVVQSDSAAVASLCNQILAVPNCPVQIDSLVQALKTASGPLQVAEYIAQIENTLNMATSQNGIANVFNNLAKALTPA